MTFWDGTRWVPAEPPTPRERPVPRRFAAAALEGILITSLVFGLIVSSVFAGQGKQAYGLAHTGYRVWAESYAFANFTVTRSKTDGTDVWVKADCVDSSGAQATAGADPLRMVTWDSANPLVGFAALDSVMNGSQCEVWLTRSPRQSTGPAPGWPELQLLVSW